MQWAEGRIEKRERERERERERQVVQLGDNGSGRRIGDSEAAPSNNVPVNPFSSRHREFVSYKLVGPTDAGADLEGHGAHVAGTLSGSLLPSLAIPPQAAEVSPASTPRILRPKKRPQGIDATTAGA